MLTSEVLTFVRRVVDHAAILEIGGDPTCVLLKFIQSANVYRSHA